MTSSSIDNIASSLSTVAPETLPLVISKSALPVGSEKVPFKYISKSISPVIGGGAVIATVTMAGFALTAFKVKS